MAIKLNPVLARVGASAGLATSAIFLGGTAAHAVDLGTTAAPHGQGSVSTFTPADVASISKGLPAVVGALDFSATNKQTSQGFGLGGAWSGSNFQKAIPATREALKNLSDAVDSGDAARVEQAKKDLLPVAQNLVAVAKTDMAAKYNEENLWSIIGVLGGMAALGGFTIALESARG